MNKKNIEAIIFDLDGVIISTDEYHYLAWKKIAIAYKLNFNRSINEKLRGVSRRESLEIILKENQIQLSEAEIKHMLNEKNNFYIKMLEQYLSEADLLPGVKEVLSKLKQLKYKIAIGSSSKNAKYILKKTNLFDLFDVISDGNNIKYSKPNPEVFNIAAKLLNVKNKYCVVIEDAQSGIEAAKNAGMIAFGIGDAQNNDKTDIKLNNLLEILDYI